MQLPEYLKKELELVFRIIKNFPLIIFAGKAQHLEECLIEATLEKTFPLQGGDCTESFKEFNANNI